MARSVAMFPAALMYQKGWFGMQEPGMSVCQNFWTGLHGKMTRKICETAHAMMMPPTIQMTRFIWCTANTR